MNYFRSVAIKAEKYSTGMLPMEIKVLLSIRRHNGVHFCDIIDYVSYIIDYEFMDFGFWITKSKKRIKL